MEKSNWHFGLVVAYLLPGFITLGGIAPFVPLVAEWLRPLASSSGSSLGPPVYAVLAATAVGMVLSCIRWLLVDHALGWTGLVSPVIDPDRLEARLPTFHLFVEYHYRYYQFYANTMIAVAASYVLNRVLGSFSYLGLGTDFGVLILCVVLLAGARDSLAKYYDRIDRLVGIHP